MHTTVRIGKTVTSKDHAVCALWALLIYFSLYLFLMPNLIWSFVGAVLLWRNIQTFEHYCQTRKAGIR